MNATVAYWVFGAAFAAGFLWIVLTLRSAHRDPRNRFSFVDLLQDPKTGMTSPSRCLMMGAFAVTSFVVVYGAFTHALTDIMFGAYVTGWVAPGVSKIFADAKVDAPPPSEPSIDNSVNVNTTGKPS